MIHVQVPATSANMGAGFDCIGVALGLYNHIWVEEIPSGLEIEVKRTQSIEIPRDERNLIYKTMKTFYETQGLQMPGIRIIQEDFIPMVRGLGSSAACIVGGLLAANALAGNPCEREALAQMAAQMEGHPDNSNPAIFGSMVVGAQTTETMQYVKMDLPEDLVFATMIPDFPMSTKAARGVLPEQYSRADVVFNTSRAALFVASMMQGKYENFDMATQDCVHQPYRAQLISDMDGIFAQAKAAGAQACYLSGAGSTLMALVRKSEAEQLAQTLTAYFKTLPNEWELKMLSPDLHGATVEIE